MDPATFTPNHPSVAPSPPTLVVDDTHVAISQLQSEPTDQEATRLTPSTAYLRSSSAMSSEEEIRDKAGGAGAPSPFNFQTQVISTTPVKPVRFPTAKFLFLLR